MRTSEDINSVSKKILRILSNIFFQFRCEMSSRLFQKSLDQCSYIFKILFILSHIFHSIIFIILLTKYTRNCISFHSIFLHPNQRPNQNPIQYLFLFVEIINDTRFGLRERQNQMENKEMEIQCDVSFEIAPKRKINLGQKKGRNAEREWRGDSCFNSVIPSLWRFSVASGTKILERAWIRVARGRA